MSQFVDHALALAASGFAVFPLQSRSKEPYPKTRGLLDASTDPEQIRKWWGIAPDSNIGLRPSPGVVVVDVDPRHDGDKTLAALEAKHGALPETLLAYTGGGGLHAFFLVPEGLAWPKELAHGIDLKGHRGYVLAAPSVHPDTGEAYRWLNQLPIAPAPPWVVACGYVPEERTQVIDEDEGEPLPEAAIEDMVARLTPLFERGKKHGIAYSVGGWLKQRGWNSADVVRVVEQLPSKSPRARVKDALDGYRAPADHGWHALKGLVGESNADVLDRTVANPKQTRKLEEAAAAESLVPVMTAAAVRAPLSQAAFAPVVATPHLLTTPDDMIARLRRLQNQGPAHPTGVPALDKALRGGMRTEKVLIAGGSPGAGKTALLRQIADHMCRNGVAIGWLAADEEPTAIDGRRLQAIGVPRAFAEQPDEFTLERAARELSPLPFVVYDAAEVWTVERVFIDLAQRYPDMPRAIFVDSLQTVRTERTTSIDSQRKQIDDVLMTAKALARAPATRAMCAFTSELARGSYRSEANADAVNDLAAFKESGGIEYYGHTLILLRSVKDDGAYIDVKMPKNRLGPKIDFLLRMDSETTNLNESFDKPQEERLKREAEAIIPEVQGVLDQAGGSGLTQNTVKGQVRRDGKAVVMALQMMRDRGLAQYRPGPRGAMLWTLTPQARSDYGLSPVAVPPPVAEGEGPPAIEASLEEMAAAMRAGVSSSRPEARA